MTAPAQSGTPVHIDDAPSVAIDAPLPPALQPYARTRARWRVGCTVDVLSDGQETFTAMLAAIASAQHSICLETYNVAGDRTGDRFKEALIARARAGVAVRMLYDAIGSFGLPSAWLAGLREAGVAIVEFNPLAPWRRRRGLSHRDHRKVLVVDDAVAFTGGLNIANQYAAVADGGAGWHDAHCRVRGAIVVDLARLFRRTWMRSGGAAYPPPGRQASAGDVAGTSFVRMIENTPRRKRASIRRAYIHVIKAARSTVWIENAYFLPDRGLRRALVRAARRGVDVCVIVPGNSDVRVVEWAALYVMRRLARFGIRFLRWRGSMLHAKTAVVDATWSTIGSYNLDAQSRFNNLEVTLEVLDPLVGSAMVKRFERDIAGCEPFDEASWHRLPWWRKALAWLAFRFRRWL
jgi:cardiolipin synthase